MNVYPNHEENKMSVVLQNVINGEEKVLDGNLVVGADGIIHKLENLSRTIIQLYSNHHHPLLLRLGNTIQRSFILKNG